MTEEICLCTILLDFLEKVKDKDETAFYIKTCTDVLVVQNAYQKKLAKAKGELQAEIAEIRRRNVNFNSKLSKVCVVNSPAEEINSKSSIKENS